MRQPTTMRHDGCPCIAARMIPKHHPQQSIRTPCACRSCFIFISARTVEAKALDRLCKPFTFTDMSCSYRRPLSLPLHFPTFVLLLATAQSALISLPPNASSVGITHHRGSLFLVGDIPTGNVRLIDARTTLLATIVQAPLNRTILGLHSDPKANLIFAAGAGLTLPAGTSTFTPAPPATAAMSVYNFRTGAEIASCPVPDGSFVADVTADDKFAYFTDSLGPNLYLLNRTTLPNCSVTPIALPPRLFSMDGISAFGISQFRGGLLIANTQLHALYFVDPLRNFRITPVLPIGALQSALGIHVARRRPNLTLLYVAQFELNIVSVYRLSLSRRARRARARLQGFVRSDLIDGPVAVAASADVLAVVNFRAAAAEDGKPMTVATLPLSKVLSFEA